MGGGEGERETAGLSEGGRGNKMRRGNEKRSTCILRVSEGITRGVLGGGGNRLTLKGGVHCTLAFGRFLGSGHDTTRHLLPSIY